MSQRTPLLVNEQIYHVFNRSVGEEEIFIGNREFKRALETIDYYRFHQKLRFSKFMLLADDLKDEYLSQVKKQKALVEIYAFSFMPNHYHLQMKQIAKGGIHNLITNFQNSYAKYFNTKNERHGSLFVNSFKAKIVETDGQLMHLSRYIHLNPVTSFLIDIKDLKDYPRTSLPWYLNEDKNLFVETNLIMSLFKSKENYLKFITDHTDYQRKLRLIKKLVLE